ncbi:hypothetical protein E8D34_03315 [Nocardioides sp. GY 10113]|uniref:EthD domain-containing protein n=1 Tax=Nocardioides sp. GY 10113 TaxID=2569761 RepID=UPI0010A8C976|nr:EthD domain-containing protein [Nocardioides sp. GY 10113]TIC88712.1 hypothetical protein E8D34_03315 [Nocardioides sp. GY 10113]
MKCILALHRDPSTGLDAELLGPGFRAALAAAGATRLQVNLDDADVAPAMRFGPGARITAVVSVWADETVAGPIVDVVRRLDPSADGWSVEERRPLPGPEVADGDRTDALANVAFLRRPDAMPRAEWLADWLERHTPVAIATQGTFGYVQNPVLEALTPGAPPVAGIVEELFPMDAITDQHAFYGSDGDEAELRRRFATLMESCARFGADTGLDLVPTSRYRFTL